MEKPFAIKLAGIVIGIHPLFPEIREMCRDYLTNESPEFEISVSLEDICFERQKSDREAIIEGRKPSQYSDAYWETLAVYRKIAEKLVQYDVMLFHGSAVAVDGIGYLFTAKSGTGKSTHTRLWREYFGDRAVMVNDDKPLLKITQNGVIAFGTPWDGKHHLNNNISVPLKAICILTRDKCNHIEMINKRMAFPILCQQSYRPNDPTALSKTISLLDKLESFVELYQLGCNMELSAAAVAYSGMNKQERR